MMIREVVGFAGGLALAPLVAAGTLLRGGRLFHSSGVVYRAEVVTDAVSEAGDEVGGRLVGPALVRLSSGLWKGQDARRPDVLGLAIRFRSDPAVTAEAAEGDQDLLTATFRSVLSFLPALLTTDVRSFLWDDYYAGGLFDAGALGRVTLRIASPRIAAGSKSRLESLDMAVAQGLAIFELEARAARAGARYERIARIRLLERVELDQSELCFRPTRVGRGLVPRGLINAMRVVPYAVAQAMRSRHTQ